MDYKDALIRRWKARTDLLWLCNNVLNMKKVSRDLNGIMLDRMYKFPRPKSEDEMLSHDRWERGKGWLYTPLIYDDLRTPAKLPDPTRMPGRRRTLLLDSRSFFKSSVNITGHCVQWILNYPDITMLVFQGRLDLAEQFLCETKDAFMSNEHMRELFPELCVPVGADFGTRQEFTCPGRTRGYSREQPTMRATSIERAGAGQHVEVMKFSDIVNEANCGPNMVNKITDLFYTSENLLVAPTYWIDVEGTRYSLKDCYGQIIDDERALQTVGEIYQVGDEFIISNARANAVARAKGGIPIKKFTEYYVRQEDRRQYNVYINACFKVAHENPTYDYDDMLNPELKFQTTSGVAATLREIKDKGLMPISRHPDHPAEKLMLEWESRAAIFACQKLNSPIGDAESNSFPVNENYPVLIARDLYRKNVRIAYHDIAVDTARTVGKRSDYTAIVVGGFDMYGRCYITEIIHGKFPEEETAEKIIQAFRKYRPQRVIMEKEPGNSGIKVWLQRKQELLGDYIPIVHLSKGTRLAKSERIGSTLRPWYITGDLRFLDDLGTPYLHLIKELRNFSAVKGVRPTFHDDILDALTDLFHDKLVLGRNEDRRHQGLAHIGEGLKERDKRLRGEALGRYLGMMDDAPVPVSGEAASSYYDITGGF